MSKPILTQIQLKEIIEYNPETGVFKWTKKKKWTNKRTVGHIDKDGYHSIMIDGRNWRAHRLAWLYIYGELPDQIDHVNHNKADNRIVNLRSVTNQQNQMNRRYTGNSAGFMGVCYDKSRKQYKPHIKVDQELINLGRYDTLEEAIDARIAAEVEYGFHINHGIIL